MAFNAKELLKYALEKMSADEIQKLLEKSDIVFGIQGTYGKFEQGVLKTEDGSTIDGGIGAVTSVKTVESFQQEKARRGSLSPEQQDAAQRQEQIDAQLRASSDPKLATTSTLLNGGAAPVTDSPVKGQPGVRVRGGVVAGDDYGRHENIATQGLATAGHSTINERADSLPADSSVEAVPSSKTVQTPENQGKDSGQAQGEKPTVSADEAKRLASEARKGK